MPRRRQCTAESRSHVSLDPSAGLHPKTSHRRQLCMERFLTWLEKELGRTTAVEHLSIQELNVALIGFGKFLFYEGEPKYLFAECINAIVDLCPQFRGQLAAPWSTLSRWEESEPVVRSMIMPASVFQAAISLSLLWGWSKFTSALLLGFHGLLRPSEFLPLQRADLVLPRDVLSCEPICYVRILHAKTSRFMLRQHARISDQGTVRFLDHIFGCMPQSELLFNCSANVFRARWNRLFAHFGINTSERNRGITPKSLRGSGASWFFHHTEDLDRVLWRGRWSAKRTLEHYLQDVMGQVLLSSLPQEKRDLVLQLAASASDLLSKSLDCQQPCAT